MTYICEFTREELAHIKAALILMRNIDDANCQKEGDQYWQDAEFSASIIHKLDDKGV
jgi:hypothetical protein